MSRLRYDFLNDVATNAEDPIHAFLAMELGAFRGHEVGLPIYDRLTKSLDEDTLLRHVTHARNGHAIYIARTVNDRSLTVGKKAPDFTLESFEGDERSPRREGLCIDRLLGILVRSVHCD